MFPIRSLLRTTYATFALAVLPCAAQQGDTYALQFMTFPMTIEPLKVELLVGEGKTVELEVPSNEMSNTVRVPRMSSLVFGETVMNEEEKPEFKVFGRGKPSSEAKQLVLLLRKGPDMASGFEVRCISSNLKDFSGGKILFVNAATSPIGGRASGAQFALKPGAHQIVKPGLEPNGRLSHVELFYSKDGEAIPFFSSMWPVAKEFRGMVFFYNDPNDANKIQLHSYQDFLDGNG